MEIVKYEEKEEVPRDAEESKKKRRKRYQKMESFDNAKEYRLILLSAAFVFLILHCSSLYALLTKQS